MMTHFINFQEDESGMVPWPVGIDHDRFAVAGLGPNLDNTARLVGFGPAGEQTVTVFVDEAMADPSKVVGMTPTFSDGTLFLWNAKVKSFEALPNPRPVGA